MNTRTRLGALFAATLIAAGTLVASATTASAATSFSLSCGSASKYMTLRVYNNSVDEVGQIEWNGDPSGSIPGDAFRAYDGFADGWGVEAHLEYIRTASTVGHDSPYWTKWSSGNLTEGHNYEMWVVMWNGGSFYTTNKCLVKA